MVYQFCEHESEIIQMNVELNHKCPICHGIMTFGKWSNRTADKVLFEGENADKIEFFVKLY
jgi:hypothetical protein